MARVLETIPVRSYMENGMPATTDTYERVVSTLQLRRTPVLKATPRRIDLGNGVSLRTLRSVPDPGSQNDASIGVELTYGRFRALFTGDAEEKQRGWWTGDSLGRVQLLKLSHHGSANGTDASWLNPLRPCAAVVSVGTNNSFNHPSPGVMLLLESMRISTYRTDRVGQVSVTADSSGSFSLSAGRPPRNLTFDKSCQTNR
jgi:competence protein ComEC